MKTESSTLSLSWKRQRQLPIALLSLLLSACAVTAPSDRAHPGLKDSPNALASLHDVPEQWQAPLPHQGATQDLRRWWAQQGDPALLELIDAAQQASPSLAAARSRILQARATAQSSGAALSPTLDASLSASRGQTQPNIPVSGILQGGLQAAWEIDLFGANRSTSRAAQARLGSTEASWHDARVSVAAETAAAYLAWRHCQAQLVLAKGDAVSKGESVKLVAAALKSGFVAQSQLDVAQASASDSASLAIAAQAQCQLQASTLVALTALPASRIAALAATSLQAASTSYNQFGTKVPVQVVGVPAQVLNQRPDLHAAAQEWAAAAWDASAADAQRYPRLVLNGSIGALTGNAGGINIDLTTWSLGPVALTMPLFDGGRRSANRDAAVARRTEAEVLYRSQVRQAVREVEEAMLNLQTASLRIVRAQVTQAQLQAVSGSIQKRQKAGFASQIETLDAERTAVGALNTVLNLQRDQALAWVALYRAVGGGWTQVDLDISGAPAGIVDTKAP